MRIALDLDGTLLNTDYLFKNILEEQGMKYSEPTSYGFSNYPTKVKEEIIDRYKHDHYSIYALPFYRGAFEKINEWRGKHELYIITARHNVEKTKQFINALLSVPFNNIYVTHNKLPLLKSLRVDLWIDDNPFDLIKIYNSGIRCCVVRHKYNEHLEDIIPSVSNINELSF